MASVINSAANRGKQHENRIQINEEFDMDATPRDEEWGSGAVAAPTRVRQIQQVYGNMQKPINQRVESVKSLKANSASYNQTKRKQQNKNIEEIHFTQSVVGVQA